MEKHGHNTTQDVVDTNGHHHQGEYVEGAPRQKGGVFNRLYPKNPNGKGGRIKNHCRRFWWCDLLVTLLIALIVVLVLIFAIIPKIAQHDINESELEVTSQEVTKSTPDSIHLKLVSLAKSSSSFHPTLEGFHAGLHLKDDEPFVYIDIPEAKANAVTEIVVEQDLQFANKEAFIRYTKTVMASEEFEIHLDGKTKIHLGGLQPMKVNYNKIVKMKGLNKLKGLNIYDLTILSGKGEILEDGSNMIGTVYIPNPSVQTLELGNVTMNLKVDGKAVGWSLLPNLTLKPGNNTVPMQSKIDQLTLIGLITSKYKSGVIPLDISGNSSISSEGKHLEYFEEAIKDNIIRVDLDAAPALKKIGINITQ